MFFELEDRNTTYKILTYIMPTFLYQKSKENEKAAQRLLGAKLFAPAIHCSYYACVLMMLDIMTTEFGKDDATVEDEAKLSNMGTHNWLIQEFRSQVFLKQPLLIADFSTNIEKLKSYRKKSDYKNIAITDRQAKEAVEVCLKELIDILTQNFSTS